MNNLKILSIFLVICYILYIIYIWNHMSNIVGLDSGDASWPPETRIERFTGFLEILSNISNKKPEILDKPKSNNIPNKSEIIELPIKKNIKYIYLMEINNLPNNNFKYIFYDKNHNKYMNITGNINEYRKELIIKDLDNNNIGNIVNDKYNKYVISSTIYPNNINIEYFNNFNSIQIYLDNDDKNFSIKNNDPLSFNHVRDMKSNVAGLNSRKENMMKEAIINLYDMKIGKIKLSDGNIKITVYEEYKTYLNLFGIGLILLLHN